MVTFPLMGAPCTMQLNLISVVAVGIDLTFNRNSTWPSVPEAAPFLEAAAGELPEHAHRVNDGIRVAGEVLVNLYFVAERDQRGLSSLGRQQLGRGSAEVPPAVDAIEIGISHTPNDPTLIPSADQKAVPVTCPIER